ncbi:MAG TPA: GAF domain-containing protein [Elusimicrobiota bacterium]|nr:GAF domain-containing protein [Elusimicrobiota bacterium]
MTELNREKEISKLKADRQANEDELRLLFSFAKEVAFTRNVDVLLDQVVGQAAKVLRAEAASLLLMNHETLQLDFKVVKGQNSEAIRNLDIHLRPGEGLAGWVAASHQPAIVNNAEDDPRFKPEVDWLTGFHTRNLIAVPMMAQGKLIGVIEVVNRLDKKDFTEHDVEFLGSVAWLAAMAFDNAQTYHALEYSRDQLTNIVESMPGGFIGVDMKSRITHCNLRAQEILALPPNAVGQRFTQILAEQPGAVEAITRAFSENQGNKRQIFHSTTPFRGRRQIGYSTLMIRSRHGELQGVGILFQDITDFAS